MHRFYAAFGGGLCTAQGDGLAGVQRFYTAGYAVALGQRIAAGQHSVGTQRLRHRCRVLQAALCILHTVLCGLLYSGLQAAVQQAAQHRMQDAQRSLQHAASVAQSLSPYAVLARGYTLTERNGVPCSVEALHPGEAVTLRGAKAAAECRIEAVHNLEKQTGE